MRLGRGGWSERGEAGLSTGRLSVAPLTPTPLSGTRLVPQEGDVHQPGIRRIEDGTCLPFSPSSPATNRHHVKEESNYSLGQLKEENITFYRNYRK